jgi:hypothetical protein
MAIALVLRKTQEVMRNSTHHLAVVLNIGTTVAAVTVTVIVVRFPCYTPTAALRR